MCGIAGAFDLTNSAPHTQLIDIAGKMADAMSHRGPDDSGVWLSPDQKCALAHRRLSIIDTSLHGHQPFCKIASKGLSYNGEVYNYIELKQQLSKQNISFETCSDTEVLYEGMRSQGAEFLTFLDGMFAFGFYDNQLGELILARDPFGEKPLYYALHEGILLFASEFAALKAVPGFTYSIDDESIATFLAFQNIPAPKTVAQNVAKVRPGHFMRIRNLLDLHNQTKYFSFRCTHDAVNHNDRDIANSRVDELERILSDSVEKRLRADVSLGAFLSGGIDSSTTVSLITQAFNRKIDTYSVGFAGSETSEHEAARAISNYLGTSHHELFVDHQQFLSFIDTLAAMDEPNSDHSCLPTFLVAQLAAKDHKVCLTGDGGDELFGGYDRYFGVYHHTLRNEEKLATREWHVGKEYISPRVLVFNQVRLQNLFGKPMNVAGDLMLSYQRQIDLNQGPVVNRLREIDVDMYLPVVLAKVDRMSMWHSLETRTPFLSPSVAQFAGTLKNYELHDTHTGKLILSKLLNRFLPEQLLQKKKQGFGISPANEALKQSLTLRFLDEIECSSAMLTRYIPKTQIRKFVEADLPQLGFYHIWSLLLIELWLQKNRESIS